ncbi:MAG: L-serine ammonia-lyase, iron-sulfur-dependent, subunit alpha, partial [Sphaerochaetaceae bacterium]|nr:L-serine ammonia-lyase, iron-sulfur-dependent, subunit alpha [Sphaerochaetaceae bacterium]
AAAGSDARMSGCSMPVIINSGSGNQGLTVTLPLYVLSSYLKTGEEKLLRSVCISELIGLALTARKNRLSALCGAFTAAIGTACGYVYLLGGSTVQMERAVNNMIGNLTGIICDGAKTTCALKIYSCLQAAATSTELALKDFAPGKESGILGDDGKQSIDYLSRVSTEGMENIDSTVLAIMMGKQNRDNC